MRRAAAFLDRDGTLNVSPAPHRYVERAEDFRWLPGAADAAAALAGAGYVLVIASNQRGVARGMVTAATLQQIEHEIQAELARRGQTVSAFKYCPHDLDAGCDCRKPRPGMLLQAARELELDLARSWMIGDSASDVAAGHAAACQTALIGTPDTAPDADLHAGSLLEVSRLILDGGPG